MNIIKRSLEWIIILTFLMIDDDNDMMLMIITVGMMRECLFVCVCESRGEERTKMEVERDWSP